MNDLQKRRACRVLLVAAFGLGAIAFAAGSSAPAIAITRGPVPMTIEPMHRLASNGWEELGSFTIPKGRTSQFVHADCPDAYPVALNGTFAFDSAGQSSDVSVGFNGPRIDESPPNYQEWGWHFYWAGGAPSALTVKFALFCLKRE